MDAFVGNWKAGPSDLENTKEYFKEVMLQEIEEAYSKGVEVSFVKEGDNYIQTDTAGGLEIMKQMLCPGGVVKTLHPPDFGLEMKYRLEDGKLITEGEYSGIHFKYSQWIEDGKLVEDARSHGSWMRATLTKV